MNSLFLIWSFSCWAEPLTDRMSNGLTGQHNVHVETLNAMPSLMDMKCRIDGMIDCMSNIDLLSKCSNWVTPFVIIVFNLVFSIKRGLSWLLEIISDLASFPPPQHDAEHLAHHFTLCGLLLLLKGSSDAPYYKGCRCHDNCRRWMSELNGYCEPSSCLFRAASKEKVLIF